MRSRLLNPPRVKEILASALRVFAERGFAAATMEEIAATAGVNKAMLYYYVGDKKELFTKALLAAVEPLRQVAQAQLNQKAPVPIRLSQLQAAFASLFAENPHLPRLMLRMLVTELENLPQEVLQASAELFSITHALVTEGIEAGTLRPANPLLVHFLLVASLALASEAKRLLARATSLGLLPPTLTLPAMDQLAPEVADILLHGLWVKE